MSHPLAGASIEAGRPVAERLLGLGLLAVGVVLLAHPQYVETLSVYPGTGWWFFPMFHAAFSALGVLAVASGWLLWRGRSPTDWELAAIAAVTILVASAYALALLRLTGADAGSMDGYGAKRALVGGVFAGLYLLGVGLASRRPRAIGLGFLASALPLGVVILEWRSGAILGPVVDVFILLTNPAILGIGHLGTMLILAAGLLGLGIGAWDALRERAEPAAVEFTGEPSDPED